MEPTTSCPNLFADSYYKDSYLEWRHEVAQWALIHQRISTAAVIINNHCAGRPEICTADFTDRKRNKWMSWLGKVAHMGHFITSGVSHGGTGRDCPLQSFDWGTAVLTVPSQSSSFGGTLLGLASWDLTKSRPISHIIILNQPLLSYSSPYAF